MEQAVSPCGLTPPMEIESRIRQLQRRMVEQGFDLALIIQNVDLFYFSGTIQKGYLLVKKGGAERIATFTKDLISQGSVPRRLRRENMNIAIDTPLLAAG